MARRDLFLGHGAPPSGLALRVDHELTFKAFRWMVIAYDPNQLLPVTWTDAPDVTPFRTEDEAQRYVDHFTPNER